MDSHLGPKDLRFVAAGEEATPRRCGLEGAMVIVRTYAMLSRSSHSASADRVSKPDSLGFSRRFVCRR
jgi:hypothetical protein